MTFTVRCANRGDYRSITKLHNAPDDPQTVERWVAADERSAQRDPHFRRVVAETGNRVVASGEIRKNWAGFVQPGRYWVVFSESPEWRGQGADSQMLGHLADGITGELREIGACLREDFVPSASFLRDYGFEERFRSWGAHLNFDEFDPSEYADAVHRLERSGFRFVPYSELASKENDVRLLELKREIDRDTESFEPIIPADSEDILGEEYLRPGLIVALDEAGEFVGMASLRRTSSDGDIGCGLTGVRREYRRRGIATALKVRSLSVAKEMGASEIGTGGGGQDSPMKRLNQKLGFNVGSEWVTFISER